MSVCQNILMIIGFLVVLQFSLSLLFGASQTPTLRATNDMSQAFKEWQIKYNKKEASPEEQSYRLSIFTENYKKIKSHNDKHTRKYTLGENQYMDLTGTEFKAMYFGYYPEQKTPSNLGTHYAQPNSSTPSDVDWRKKDAVNPIKDQGQCGSCWAFSTIGSTEACSAIYGSGLMSFSEQELVDCSKEGGNAGCNGGLPDNGFEYIMKKGIALEKDYPYSATDGKCKDDKVKSAFKISGYKDVKSGDCDALEQAVAQNPVSVGVDAEQWQFYQSGVFTDCEKSLDHGVVVVGYKDGQYWIVRNSWGTSWGEEGYIRLGWGDTCGVCDAASYPVA